MSTVTCAGMVPVLRPTLLAGSAGLRRARSVGNAPPSPSPLRSDARERRERTGPRPPSRSRRAWSPTRTASEPDTTKPVALVVRRRSSLAQRIESARQSGRIGRIAADARCSREERALEVGGRVLGLRKRVRHEELMTAGARLFSDTVTPSYQLSPNGGVLKDGGRRAGAPSTSLGRRPGPSAGTIGL